MRMHALMKHLSIDHCLASYYPVANLSVHTMPDHEGKALLHLTTGKEGVRIFLDGREVWIEVNDEHDLVVHLYRDQESEEIVTATIMSNQIIVAGDYTEEA